jgi:hypothetical protein
VIPQEKLTPEQRAARGHEARRLLEHPLMVEAFANLRLNYYQAWADTPPDKVHDRDGIYHAGRVLDDVLTHLRIVMDNGKIERAQIKKMLDAKAEK